MELFNHIIDLLRRVLALCCASFYAGILLAQTFTSGSLTYRILTDENKSDYGMSGNCVEVTASSAYAGSSLNIPQTVKYNSVSYSVTKIDGKTFINNTNIQKVTLPEGMMVIGKNAFNGCSNLSSINFPKSLTLIRDYAFYGCKSLTKISIAGFFYCVYGAFDSSVKQLQILSSCDSFNPAVLNSLSGLESLSVEAGNTAYEAINNILFTKGKTTLLRCAVSKSGALSIEKTWGVETIGKDAFYKCKSLTQISIPSTVKNIENGAFYECI